MRAKWISMLIAITILFQGGIVAHGQEVANNKSISDLKEQIERLLKVERDETVPADVKSLNHGFLEARRAELRVLLQKRINSLRSYRTSVGSALTSAEIQVVDNSIRDLEKDLQELGPGAPQSAPQTEAVASASGASFAAPDEDRSVVAIASPKAGFSGRLTPSAQVVPAVPAATPDFTPKGSASEPGSENLIRDDVRRQLASIEADIIKKSRSENLLPHQTREQARMAAIDFTANPQLYAELLTNLELPHEEFVKDLEAARIDKQVGGAEGNAGSTTLVSKGGTPAVLGFAVENGGLTRTVDGTTVTFRGNPVGLVEAFQKTGFIPSYQDSKSTELLRKLSFSVSFDTSRGNTPGTLLANRQQLSSYSFRYEFKNDRDPRNKKYADEWAKLVSGHAQQVANALSSGLLVLDSNPEYAEWLRITKQAVANASDADLPNVLAQRFEAFQEIKMPPEFVQFINSFRTEFIAYRQDRSKLLEIIAKAPIFTVEYVNNRRPGLIDTSTLNFIAETGMFQGKADLTYNGTVTFFNSSPGAGMKRVRNFDHSLRLDMPIGDPRRFSGILTFAGKYKRLMEDEMTSGGAKMKIKGDMATGQLLFTIPIKGSGFKIPISLTFANRTEFVKEKEVRGNFGFTFDLDSILEKFKPF